MTSVPGARRSASRPLMTVAGTRTHQRHVAPTVCSPRMFVASAYFPYCFFLQNFLSYWSVFAAECYPYSQRTQLRRPQARVTFRLAQPAATPREAQAGPSHGDRTQARMAPGRPMIAAVNTTSTISSGKQLRQETWPAPTVPSGLPGHSPAPPVPDSPHWVPVGSPCPESVLTHLPAAPAAMVSRGAVATEGLNTSQCCPGPHPRHACPHSPDTPPLHPPGSPHPAGPWL